VLGSDLPNTDNSSLLINAVITKVLVESQVNLAETEMPGSTA